ncbi:MAG: VIT1/CCC1 transporter family protein [Acidimicrobiales bacterium]
MRPPRTHGSEQHFSSRGSWLRAGVLGANDGLISTSSLVAGVAAASSGRAEVIIAGVAALTAGALSMAAGEYVSVSSQRDTELADLARERRELERYPEAEKHELYEIYRDRGLSDGLARQVAAELSARDDLDRIHARDELGIDVDELAKPVEAAVVSALSFAVGAILPVATVLIAPESARLLAIIVVTLVGLGALGVVSARLGGAPVGRAVIRVLVGGLAALLISVVVGNLTGAAV